jgi:hypothetical protein
MNDETETRTLIPAQAGYFMVLVRERVGYRADREAEIVMTPIVAWWVSAPATAENGVTTGGATPVTVYPGTIMRANARRIGILCPDGRVVGYADPHSFRSVDAFAEYVHKLPRDDEPAK